MSFGGLAALPDCVFRAMQAGLLLDVFLSCVRLDMQFRLQR